MSVHHERCDGFPDAVLFTEIDDHSRTRSLRNARGVDMSPPPELGTSGPRVCHRLVWRWRFRSVSVTGSNRRLCPPGLSTLNSSSGRSGSVVIALMDSRWMGRVGPGLRDMQIVHVDLSHLGGLACMFDGMFVAPSAQGGGN